ncbi:hypothetical protein PsYK624_122020 [Phanerochaete sordida]|uniref:Aminoglycoside phosphotransferase domain-containing protein n=1 Tax=Phanerochaete sordida TaxID=48140 RepID=A0A9P3LIT5_9APHY|nr:hypothetical protein PsYK624_122020 [Phanerochaete sordida]
MPGKTLRECWGTFDRQQKETVIISYAQHVTEIFDINVPSAVGSTCGGAHNNGQTLSAAPFMGRGPTPLAPEVYTNVYDHIDYVFTAAHAAARASAPSAPDAAARAHLLALLHAAATDDARACVLPRGSCALAHDPDDGDVVVHARTGEVAGLLDWEFHALVPRALAAAHPAWLRHDGVHDPRCARAGRWWLAPRAESAEMLALFEEVVKSKSQAYYEALRSGSGLRSILEWVSEMGTEDYWARLRRWMTGQKMLPQDKPAVKKQKSTMFAP